MRGPAQGWNEATVGSFLTIAGIVGLLAQTPAGSLIDRAGNNPRMVMAAALLVNFSSVALPIVHGYVGVVATQSVAAIAGAVFAPAISATALGLVGVKAFARRIGRNEAFNHAGNAVSAGLAGLLAWRFGPVVVFYLMGALTVASIVAALRIDNDAIDNEVARGCGEDESMAAGDPRGIMRTLLENRALHLFAIVVGRNVERWGTKPIFLVGFGFLPARGTLYTLSNDPRWLVGVQAFDGIGAGIFGALFPVVIADLTAGTGRFNVAQGAVATTQGLGAALSVSLAGAIIVAAGYSVSFLTLAAIVGVGFAVYLFAMPETKS